MISGEYIMVKAPDDFPGTRYQNKYCLEHQLVYWQHYGIIPGSDEVIHHKDENKHNNDINNLKLLKRKDHATIHKKEIGREYVTFKYPNPKCGKIFDRPRNNSHLVKGGYCTCCSRSCSAAISNINKNILKELVKDNIVKEYRRFIPVITSPIKFLDDKDPQES